jgi:hypothetical protein
MRSRASSFKWEYPLLSPRSPSNFLRLLPRLLVTSIHPFIFPSITCFRRQFLRKIWPIQLAFRFLLFLTNYVINKYAHACILHVSMAWESPVLSTYTTGFKTSRYSDLLRAGPSGDRIPVETRFFALIHTGTGTHPASCKCVLGLFPGRKAATAWR